MSITTYIRVVFPFVGSLSLDGYEFEESTNIPAPPLPPIKYDSSVYSVMRSPFANLSLCSHRSSVVRY